MKTIAILSVVFAWVLIASAQQRPERGSIAEIAGDDCITYDAVVCWWKMDVCIVTPPRACGFASVQPWSSLPLITRWGL